jgi:uncharacterized protein YabE (DUF348 family)/3D (Asp-Asp-Asp) domain-containing protein
LTYWLQGARQRPQARQLKELRLRELQPANLRLFENPHARLSLALAGTLAVVALLAFVVFPPRKLVVDADGQEIVVVSRQHDIDYVLDSARVKRDPGDVLVMTGDAIAVERALPVLVSVDGRTLSWRSRAPTVEALLSEIGVRVSPYDAITFNGHPAGLNDSVLGANLPLTAAVEATGSLGTEEALAVVLDVRRALPVTVIEDGRTLRVQSTGSTLGQVLREAGIRLGPADRVFPSPATPVRAGMEVSIDHATTFTLRIGESTRTFYTHQQTLEAALAEAGLTFGPEDRVDPPLSVAVTDGMEARIVRVTGRPFYETETIGHVTVFAPDESLSGTQTRRVAGSDGQLVTEYRIGIEDGVEVEKTLIKQYYDPQPVDSVIYYAASALNSTTYSPPDHQVTRVMRMYGTWYNAASSGKPAGHPAYGITRSGMYLTKGIVAVDPNVIPLGTRLYIPGYGFAIAADTGGGIIGDRIDMGYPDGVAVDWYTGWTDVYILAP